MPTSSRPRFFDDLAGVAGGAMSALVGIREEVEAMVRARLDEAIRRLELVRREELDAVAELASNARAGQEAAEAKLAALEARVAALEGASGAVATPGATSGTTSGATSGASPGKSPMAFDAGTPAPSLGGTAGVAPGATPGGTLGEAGGATPGETLDEAGGAASA
jgi:hypothetical protein